MDWQSVPKGIKGAVVYSSRFNYPLTSKEIWFWQVGTSLPKPHTTTTISRTHREKVSFAKWQIAQKYLPLLSKNPFILAIFITGSLAMNNCTPNDDIDLMIISAPNTLWLSRLWHIFTLGNKGLRRPPHLSQHNSPKVKNTFCDNLYLDFNNLYISEQNLYTAHEVLQAKPLYDHFGIHRRFLLQNSWTQKYLPIAYRETLKQTKPSTIIPHNYYFLLNLLAFIIQYLYMVPKITNEKISLRQAFFHPRKFMI